VIPLKTYQKKFPEVFSNFDKEKLPINEKDPKVHEVEVTEYDTLLHILSNGGKDYLKDWYREEHIRQLSESKKVSKQVTYADWEFDSEGNRVPVEKHFALACSAGFHLSLDYIFEYIPEGEFKVEQGVRSLNTERQLGVIERSCKINQMKVKG
jgi:hypothetical protein